MLNQLLAKSAGVALIIAVVYGLIYASGIMALISTIANALQAVS